MESSDQIESKFCGSCGVKHAAEDKFCKSCGESIKVKFNLSEPTFHRLSDEKSATEKTKSNLPLAAGILILILIIGLIVKGQSSPEFGTDGDYSPQSYSFEMTINDPARYGAVYCTNNFAGPAEGFTNCRIALQIRNVSDFVDTIQGNLYLVVDGNIYKSKTFLGETQYSKYINEDINPDESIYFYNENYDSYPGMRYFEVPKGGHMELLFLGGTPSGSHFLELPLNVDIPL